MPTSLKRTQRDYSLAFKLSVVDQVEKGEMTYKQAQDKYGIQGCSTVLVWLRKHGNLDWSKGTPPYHYVKLPCLMRHLHQSNGLRSLNNSYVILNRKLNFLKQLLMF